MQMCHCYFNAPQYYVSKQLPDKEDLAGLIVTPQPGTSNPLVVEAGQFIKLAYENESQENVPYSIVRIDQGTHEAIATWHLVPGWGEADFKADPGTYVVTAQCPSGSCDTTIILVRAVGQMHLGTWSRFDVEALLSVGRATLGLR